MEYSKIYCGDNIPLLREFHDEGHKFDLILTDPPYNVGKDFGNETDNQSRDEFCKFMVGRCNYMSWSVAPRGSLILFCSHLHVSDFHYWLVHDPLYYRRMLIWYYRNGLSRQNNTPVTEYEPFLWYTENDKEWTYNADDIRIPYRSERVKNPVYKTNKKGEKVAWTPDPRGAKRGDVWEYPALAGALYKDERTEHPTQKPEALITDIIKAFCPKGADGMYEGTVLDPFAGSGTVPVCCERLNRAGHRIKWVGIELEQKWVDVGYERLGKLNEWIL